MSLSTAIAIYFVIWWITLFAVLPWGVRSQHENGEMAPGTDPGAPVVAGIGKKLLWTTGVSAAVFGVLWVIHTFQIITLDDMARFLGSPR